MDGTLTTWLTQLADGPLWMLLLAKASVLLVLAWLLHFSLSRANPRWRVLLWRSLAVGLVALPVAEILTPELPVEIARPEPAPTVTVEPVAVTEPTTTSARCGGRSQHGSSVELSTLSSCCRFKTVVCSALSTDHHAEE